MPADEQPDDHRCAEHRRHSADGKLGGLQQLLRGLDAAVVQVIHDGLPGHPPEQAAEIVGGKVELCRHLGKRKLLPVVGGKVGTHLLNGLVAGARCGAALGKALLLNIVQDEQQNKYYDNRITLKITRADGSIFLDHTFVKADFANLVDDKYGKNGALLGLAFDCIENNNLRFGASVGSPDAMSDEFIPITVTVTRSGEIKSERDTQLDA